MTFLHLQQPLQRRKSLKRTPRQAHRRPHHRCEPKPDPDVFGIIRDSAFLQRLHVAFMALGALAVVGLEDADDVSSAGL